MRLVLQIPRGRVPVYEFYAKINDIPELQECDDLPIGETRLVVEILPGQPQVVEDLQSIKPAWRSYRKSLPPSQPLPES